MKLSEYNNKIDQTKLEIYELELNVKVNIEQLGNRYKELGDLYSNYFLDLFVLKNEINHSLTKLSFSYYENASNLFLKNRLDVKYIYSVMAWGNAYKESFLPSMEKNAFPPLYKKARDKYIKGIDFALNFSYTKEYLFVMLEQINLEIRKKVWELDLKPKRINIYHSLKSPISHVTLEGLYYYSFLNHCEIWEYRYGGVRTFDNKDKFINDRLKETSAVIFILSEEYSTEQNIIEFEVKEVCNMLKKNDPLQVYGVDLGNQDLIDELSKYIEIYKMEDIQKIFQKSLKSIKDIYECRKFRKKM